MPELPEVHTTVTGLQKVLPKLTIKDIWCDMWSSSVLAKNTIKDKSYFPYFKKHTLGAKIKNVERRAKYILINLENDFTIIIHMKMTGHLMYGKYKYDTGMRAPHSVFATWGSWLPVLKNSPLSDKYNRHIHVVLTLSNGNHLAFCDSRKFGSMSVMKTTLVHKDKLAHIGPEPLEKTFTENNFKERLLMSPNRAIKTVLMDQKIIAGIGNIYSDEMLHLAHILPTRTSKSLSKKEMTLLFKSMKKVLEKGIDFGGDSMSDYRNVEGERGAFQGHHLVYLRNKEKCKSKSCKGIIKKSKIGGRSAHFCPICQK
jgi:formamidopyrimidine-DNA glycosylase